MEFLKYTEKLNEIAKTIQEEQEIISEEDIIKAVTYLNNIYIEDTGDCLIFLSALNLCNTYVKQNNSKIGYSFKKGIKYLIDILNYRNIKDIYIDRNQNNGTLYIFQIGNIQFSFHDEKRTEIKDQYLKELSWDGIRKQKCAKSIFNSTIENKLRVANKTYRGHNLKEKVEKVLNNYKEEKSDIKELITLKL